ncbi:Serpentine receptor class gamma [Meloidogyne graminicola]|uniref:Serpentine receptor class gamma n=1 Tax=Meloidogyne graminicola TaxID=189291 RepID=A0A8S9ZGI9_9BILA|nr:Serpentine receptor class gamma [Meloidogyne graminicola]
MSFFLSSPIVFLANTVYLPFIISVVIGVPSACLYLFEILIIIKNYKEYNSSFFHLFIARAILVSIFLTSFGQRFGKIGLFTNIYLLLPQWFLSIIYFFNYYCIHSENIATTLFLFNRLFSILFPFLNEKIWIHFLPLTLLLIFILPLSITIQIFFLDIYIRIQSDNQTITFDYHKKSTDIKSTQIAAYSCVIFMFICLIINLITIISYKIKIKPKTQNNGILQIGQNEMIEKRLLFYSIWTFIGQLLISISTVIKIN